jgi:hypothetical protein
LLGGAATGHRKETDLPEINYPKKPAESQASGGTNGTTVLSEALRLNSKGFSVVPCDGKKPIGMGWQDKRLTPVELRSELAIHNRNIAIVLNQSDLIDIECDSEEAEVRLLEMFGGEIPRTPTWQSKRGRHRLFVRPEGLPEKATRTIDGVEFHGLCKSKGATSVIPPSIHPDGPKYEWLPNLSLYFVKPATLSKNIVEMLRSPDQAPSSSKGKEGIQAIPEGSRNDELFREACNLVRSKFREDMIGPVIHAMNENLCKPPLPTAEVEALIKSAMSKKSEAPEKAGDALVRLVLANADLWHTPDGKGCATLRRNGHSEHWPLKSKDFKRWLSKEYYDKEKTTVASQTLQDVIAMLEGKAVFDGKEHPIFVRVAGHEGRVYLDLADEDWRAIEVDATGWRVLSDCPVRFRRLGLMKPLAVPVRGGSLEELRPFVNMDDNDWCVLKGFLFDLLRPEGPRMILQVSGEQGSAKTTTGRLLRWCIDPSECESRAAPQHERDLRIAAGNGWLCAFDNLSYITPDMADALCRLSSGGGFGVRSHYEDEEETVFNAQRPLVLNGIEEIGTRADMLDRSIVLHLPTIEDARRMSETEFKLAVGAVLPAVLGTLLDAVSVALRNLAAVRAHKPEGGWPRMVDFAQWVTAAEESLGMKKGEFLTRYRANRDAANEIVLESSPVAKVVVAMLKRAKTHDFDGDATKLLEELNKWAECLEEGSTRNKHWPKSPRSLAGILIRLSPSLRKAGITIDRGRTKKEGKVWHLALTAPTAKVSAITPTVSAKNGVSSQRCPSGGVSAKPAVSANSGALSHEDQEPPAPLTGIRGVSIGDAVEKAKESPPDYGKKPGSGPPPST